MVSASRGDYDMMLVKCKLGDEEHLGSGITVEDAKRAAALHVILFLLPYTMWLFYNTSSNQWVYRAYRPSTDSPFEPCVT